MAIPTLRDTALRLTDCVYFGDSLSEAAANAAVPDGDKGDITVSGTGLNWQINAGVVSTNELGGTITAVGKAILDDLTVADQRTTLGLGTADEVRFDSLGLGVPGALEEALHIARIGTRAGIFLDGQGAGGYGGLKLGANAVASEWLVSSGYGGVAGFRVRDNNAAADRLTISDTGVVNAPQGYVVGANTVWHAGNDGAGSGLDADLLDGQNSAAFAAASHSHTVLDISIGGGITGVLVGRTSLGSGPAAEVPVTSAGFDLLGDATAADQRTTLGLGTIATQAASAVSITGGAISGVTLSASSVTATGLTSGIVPRAATGGALVNSILQSDSTSIGLGGAPSASAKVYVSGSTGGGTARTGLLLIPTFATDVTSTGFGIQVAPATAAGAQTLSGAYGIIVSDWTLGSGSSITSQYGLFVQDQTKAAGLKVGVRSQVSSGTGKWNLYMDGTAANHIAGTVLIGTTTSTGAKLEVNGDIKATAIKLTTGAAAGYVLTSDADGDATWQAFTGGMTYKGTWDANTNTPTLADGTGTAGDTYAVTVSGTQFTRTFTAGGWAIYNGTIWEPVGTSVSVTSVNGLTGAVSLALASSAFVNQGTTTQVLHGNAAGNPSWGAVALGADVSGTLPLANGGTGQTSAQAAMDSMAGAVTSGQYLRGNGTNVVMSAIQAADVPTLNQNTSGTAAGLSATLAVASGGTGATTLTGLVRGNGTSPITGGATVALGSEVSGTLPVTSGGTGLATATAGEFLFGAGTSAFSSTPNVKWDSTAHNLMVTADAGLTGGDCPLQIVGNGQRAAVYLQGLGTGGYAAFKMGCAAKASEWLVSAGNTIDGFEIRDSNVAATRLSISNTTGVVEAPQGYTVGGTTVSLSTHTHAGLLSGLTSGRLLYATSATAAATDAGATYDAATDTITSKFADKGGAVFNAIAYGADPTGAASSVSAINSACSAATAAGGGVVYLPAGDYLIDGYVSVPVDVALRGYRHGMKYGARGAHLLITVDAGSPGFSDEVSIASGNTTLTAATPTFIAGDAGKSIIVVGAGVAGADLSTTIASYTSSTSVTLSAAASTSKTNGSAWWRRAAISLDDDASISDVAISYPNQTDTNPAVPYPFAIRLGPLSRVENIWFHETYRGIDAGWTKWGFGFASSVDIRNVRGTFLKRGIALDRCADFSTISNVQGLGTIDPSRTNLIAFQKANAELLVVGQADGLHVENVNAFGLKTGMRFTYEGATPPWGVVIGCKLDSCQVGIDIEATSGPGITISDCEIGPVAWNAGDCHGIRTRTTNGASSNVAIRNVSFWNAPAGAIYSTSIGHTEISGCTLYGCASGAYGIDIANGTCKINGNTWDAFLASTLGLRLQGSVTRAVVVGNDFGGKSFLNSMGSGYTAGNNLA